MKHTHTHTHTHTAREVSNDTLHAHNAYKHTHQRTPLTLPLRNLYNCIILSNFLGLGWHQREGGARMNERVEGETRNNCKNRGGRERGKKGRERERVGGKDVFCY